MSLRHTQNLFLQDVIKLLQKAQELGFEPTFGEVYRPIEMQQIYIKTGRSQTMNSMHLKRLAIDLNLFRDGRLANKAEVQPLGDFWTSLNPKNVWGGNWKSLVDTPHFERKE